MARAAAKTASAGRWAAESTSGRKYHGTRYAPARPAQTRSSDGREEARAGRGRDALRERGRPRHGDRRDRDDPARPRAHHARDRRADLRDDWAPLEKAIKAQDWAGFQEAFDRGIDSANAWHEKKEKPYIRWKLPDHPPPDLDLTPRR